MFRWRWCVRARLVEFTFVRLAPPYCVCMYDDNLVFVEQWQGEKKRKRFYFYRTRLWSFFWFVRSSFVHSLGSFAWCKALEKPYFHTLYNQQSTTLLLDSVWLHEKSLELCSTTCQETFTSFFNSLNSQPSIKTALLYLYIRKIFQTIYDLINHFIPAGKISKPFV